MEVHYPNAKYLDLLNPYLSSDTLIKTDILNLFAFNRSEATNMVMFYKTMMVSGRTSGTDSAVLVLITYYIAYLHNMDYT